MWDLFKPQPQQTPRALTAEELARIRLALGEHVRALEGGRALAEGAGTRMMFECSLVMVEYMAQMVDEMRQLREEIMVSRAPVQPFSPSLTNQAAPPLSPSKGL